MNRNGTWNANNGPRPENTIGDYAAMHQGGKWRGRDDDHDFWGMERHPVQVHPQGAEGARSVWEKVKGAFVGKGPKNWTRSDERIREDVCERLHYHPYVDASDVEVVVRTGEVTLTGTVDDRQAKRLVEDVAEDVRGVTDIHNQLRIRMR